MTLTHLLAGVAVVLAIEGLVYALFPQVMRRALGQLSAAPDATLRVGGLIAAIIGTGLAWLLIAS